MNQHEKILRILRNNKVRGVANHRFVSELHILDYTARISELRQDGHNIVAERQKLPNGRSTNVYKYFLIEAEKPKQDKGKQVDGMKYELQDSKPDWLSDKLSTLKAKVLHR